MENSKEFSHLRFSPCSSDTSQWPCCAILEKQVQQLNLKKVEVEKRMT